MANNRLAGYSNTDDAEINAINIFAYLVENSNVKLDIKKRDKYPNIDGYVELIDDDRSPSGKLEVQGKKLPNNFDPEKPKIRLELQLLDQSKYVTANPVLHIGVDISREKVYWLYANENLINTRGERIGELNYKTTTIPLNLDDITNGVIDRNKKDFINRWKIITKNHIRKVHEFDELKKLYSELNEKASPILGTSNQDFINVHIFLDKLNYLLKDFPVIKDRFYGSDTWKLGYAYFKEDPEGYDSYAIYPISWSKNDIQIKEVKALERLKVSKIWTTSSRNLIKDNPKEYAIEIIKSKISDVLYDKLLFHNNEFLVTEYVFSFIDKYLHSLIVKKDKYSVEEILNVIKPVDQVSTRSNQINLFYESLSYLEEKGIEYIERIYSPKDYSRNQNLSWVWNTLSPKAVKTNLEIFFSNLPKVYEDIVSQNFPELRNNLPLFKNASRVIMIYNVKESYRSFEDHPRMATLYLDNESNGNPILELYEEGENIALPKINEVFSFKMLEINGDNYNKFSSSIEILDFIYDDQPMLNYVYNELKNNLNNYFENIK